MIPELADLKFAWEMVRRGSPTPGVDGITPELFLGTKDEKLALLQQQIHHETYHPQPARGFYLPKRNGGKRLIGISTIGDRIVQRWLLEELYFPLEEAFSHCSYAYRPGRNIQQAVKHLYFHYQYQPAWIIQSDIKQFFDCLSWALLLSLLEDLKLNGLLLALIEQQLKTAIKLQNRILLPTEGVLQGSILSGALANLYLNDFDHDCLRGDINLVRYGDDFAVACRSHRTAEKTLTKLENWLATRHLKLQPEKTRIVAPDQSFIFLGYEFRAGQVFAPPPVIPKNSALALPSGSPRTQRKLYFHSFLSQPPKACSLKKGRNLPPLSPANPKHYFCEDMTTLYVTDQGAYLKAQNHQFQVYHQQELRCQIPVNRISHIVLFGCCNMSHGAVRLSLSRRIPVLYLSQRGRYFGRLETEGQAKVAYLAQQIKRADDAEFVRNQAETIVRAKLHNSRILLKRLGRRRKNTAIEGAVTTLATIMDNLPSAATLDELRGHEGNGAKVYFQALGTLFLGEFTFSHRTKRPPTDPINSLLSLGYTLLHQNLHSFVEVMGLHTHFGQLHVPRDNHPALVSDLVEEFRAQVVDSFVAYLVNKKIFTAEDFTPADERGGIYLHHDSLKKFLKHWEEKLQSEITHPYTGFKVSLRRCFELQVREYIACLMGDQDYYRPMLWQK